MSLASVNNTMMKLPTLPFLSQPKHLFSGHPTPNLLLPRVPLSRSVISHARRRNNSGKPVTSSKKKKSRGPKRKGAGRDDDDEDAFEALFQQLEEDLKNDKQIGDDDDDDISEGDLALLERELDEALAEDEDLKDLFNMVATVVGEEEQGDEDEGEEEEDDREEIVDELGQDEEDEDEDEDEEEEEEEDEQISIKLRSWQLRRLAHALKVGRRKTSIKNLAADLCLDRAVVLELLRDPPPNLMMLSETLPDESEPTMTIADAQDTVSDPSDDEPSDDEPSDEEISHPTEPKHKVEAPIHVLQGSWSAQKRLKKVHLNTLESVYRRTKRPTNAMISSIVQVTNLPRKRIVKWFEDKRTADGLPEERRAYQRSSTQPVVSK